MQINKMELKKPKTNQQKTFYSVNESKLSIIVVQLKTLYEFFVAIKQSPIRPIAWTLV